jgi:hypothetical protein
MKSSILRNVTCIEFREEKMSKALPLENMIEKNALYSGEAVTPGSAFLKSEPISHGVEVSSSLPSLHYGKFLIPKLKKNQGLTIANTLRRILLYEIPATGITSISCIQEHISKKIALAIQAQMLEDNIVDESHNNTATSQPSAVFGQIVEGSGYGSASATTSSHIPHVVEAATVSFPNLQRVNEKWIPGNIHEFSRIPGLLESFLEFKMNLESVVLQNDLHGGNDSLPGLGHIYIPRFLLKSRHSTTNSDLLITKDQNPYVPLSGFYRSPIQSTKSTSFILRAKHLQLPKNISAVYPEQYLGTVTLTQINIEGRSSARAEAVPLLEIAEQSSTLASYEVSDLNTIPISICEFAIERINENLITEVTKSNKAANESEMRSSGEAVVDANYAPNISKRLDQGSSAAAPSTRWLQYRSHQTGGPTIINSKIFPVKKINYTIENSDITSQNLVTSKIGENANYQRRYGSGRATTSSHSDSLQVNIEEQIIFEIWTNGAISPQKALEYAIRYSINLFQKFIDQI